MRFAIVVIPVGEVVGVAVGIVEESAFFYHEATGVRAVAALVEAQRASADDLGVDVNEGCSSFVLFGLRAVLLILLFFFFNDTATTEIYTLSLHDALPIFLVGTTLIYY